MIECFNCSGLNNEDARFCRHCGSPLYDTDYSSTKLPLGTILDERYKIIDYIAKGGMGAVYKAVDLKESKVWAVKEMLDYFDTEEEREYSVERFATEAQILYELDHPSIPRFADCFVSENRYYLIMEFIDGKDLLMILDEALASGKPGLDEEQIKNWAIQLCNVLFYLHNQDPPIIYRDLKPGNIMLTRANKVYLIDFGIARLFDPRTKGTMVGTQGYAPPEQYKGETEPRSDMYSLAACLHHLLTGKDPRNDIPFTFPSLSSIRNDLSESMELILEKALQMKPEERFKNMFEMKEALSSNKFPPPFVFSQTPGTKIVAPEGTDIPEAKVLEPENKDTKTLTREDKERIHKKQLSYWYMFRSNRRHQGKTPFGRSIKGKVNWAFPVGSPIRSSPVVSSDGTIYVGANDGRLYAISQDGKLKWAFQSRGRISSSPSLNSDGSILVGSTDCYLYSIDPDGNLNWKFKTYGRIRSSPVVSLSGTIYIGSYDHYLYAIDSNGKLQWRLDLDGYIEAAPAINGEDEIYIACKGAYNGGSKVFCINPNGKIEWDSVIHCSVKSSPCISKDGVIFLGGMDGVFYAFQKNGKNKWTFNSGGPITTSALTDDKEMVTFGSFDKNIYNLSMDGKLNWKYQALSPIASSPVLIGKQTIVFGADDYYIYALSTNGKIKWRIKGSGKVRSSPAVGVSGALYVGCDDGKLYSIV
ncbi:MAG: PQQ-binding-like beta-propeller repeat protein [Vulcanimicrobiota bacterium]